MRGLRRPLATLLLLTAVGCAPSPGTTRSGGGGPPVASGAPIVLLDAETPTAVAVEEAALGATVSEHALATASPAASPTAAVREVRIANTDGQGVYVRASRNPEDRVKAYAERTVMAVLGPVETDGGRTWVPVRAPDGLEGWVPAEYTVQLADELVVGTQTSAPQPVEGAIAGLNADVLVGTLRSQGFDCIEAAKLQDTLYWSCSLSLDGAALLYSVKLWGARADAIQYVTLSSNRGGGQPNDAEAASFLGPLSAQLAGDQEGARAREWVERTLSQVGDDVAATLTVGSLAFTLYGPPAARVLDVATSGGARPIDNTSPDVGVGEPGARSLRLVRSAPAPASAVTTVQ